MHEHHRKPLYCVAFNHCDPRNQDLFASVGANRATVYRARPDGAIEVVQVYADADVSLAFPEIVCGRSRARVDARATLKLRRPPKQKTTGERGVLRVPVVGVLA